MPDINPGFAAGIIGGMGDIPLMEEASAPAAADPFPYLDILATGGLTTARKVYAKARGPKQQQIRAAALAKIAAIKAEQEKEPRFDASRSSFADRPAIEPAEMESIPLIEPGEMESSRSIQSIQSGIGKQPKTRAVRPPKPPPVPPPKIEPEQAEIMDLSYFRKARGAATTAAEYTEASEGIAAITGEGAAAGAFGGPIGMVAGAGLAAAAYGLHATASPQGSIRGFMPGGAGGTDSESGNGAGGIAILTALNRIASISTRA